MLPNARRTSPTYSPAATSQTPHATFTTRAHVAPGGGTRDPALLTPQPPGPLKNPARALRRYAATATCWRTAQFLQGAAAAVPAGGGCVSPGIIVPAAPRARLLRAATRARRHTARRRHRRTRAWPRRCLTAGRGKPERAELRAARVERAR